MGPIIGIILTFSLVFGGFIIAGGHIEVILEALPIEGMIIGGIALGAFVTGNSGEVIKHTLGGLGKAFKGAKWKKQDYIDLIGLMYMALYKRQREGTKFNDFEDPKNSALFKKYPKILNDHLAINMICDTLRNMSMRHEDPHQVEAYLENLLEKVEEEHMEPSHALQGIADGLPAYGIVAAVLGVVKTMSSIDKPPAVLGGLIAAALVGTFLGIFLGYGVIGPLAGRIKQINEADARFYKLIRDVFVSTLSKNALQVAIEVGRANIPSSMQPTFAEAEAAINKAKGS
ncbi:flagellar motor stator protein MotA [Tistrella mobilis]|jgi:chemotaxis protein MotA|uniref:flagellar motor stator protein MotA n=1 Tax=Tistrella mobilis TaxID=171437 RepID=UPI0035589AA6